MTAALRVGTRGSDLALAQTKVVAAALGKASGRDVELVTVTTHGDTSRESLATLGGTGVFASALRESLLAGDCDVIVHSLKDLPTASHPGLVIGAVPRRADARDVLCASAELRAAGTATLGSLPAGSRIGTGSPRRAAQLRAARTDVDVVDIRGNVDTRLGRLAATSDAERLDAIILAAAGLGRLGRSDAASQTFSLSDWPTAPGQGALALEVREGDERGSSQLAKALASVNHASTRATVTAERLVLAGLEAGCAAPIGATALIEDGLLFVTATVYKPDGTQRLTSSHATSLEGAAPHALLEAAQDAASRVVAELLKNGAAELAPIGGAA
jgi:hydroxymethylbilane synthase